MDNAEYLPMFLAEAREHLQELNLAVVRIEEQPDDRETVDAIFRIAHSLKGMSATMGFTAVAALTHQMEDVFELLRQRRDGLGRDAVDALLECLDALSAAVESIDSEGEEGLDPAALIARLKGLVGERSEAQDIDRRGGSPAPEDILQRAQGRRIAHVVIRLDDDASMPAVRAYMALAAVAEHGELLGSSPTDEAVDAFEGRVIEAWVVPTGEDAALVEAAANVADVAAVDLEEVSVAVATERGAVDVPPPLPAPDPAVVAPGAPAGEPAAARPAGGSGHKGSSTVRVDAERLDGLMHLMGELVVFRTHVESLAAQADVPGLSQAMQDLTRSSQALQAMVMQVRMIPVEAVFLRFPRLVRDLSSKLSKQVELVLTGKETELDRTVVDALGDPIVHLVRNSLDHGLEPPDERVAAGKPAAGMLEISARHAGGNVVISVRDDGRGIDPARVAAKAVERGLIAPEAAGSVDAKGAVELLFAPGFSTAEQTSDISGRGVGMDAVRTTIRELGGEVIMTSEPGQGTTAQIRLPLTLAIMSALLVDAGGVPFAIPLDRIERTLRLEDQVVRSVAGRRMLVMRDGVVPLYDGAAALGYPAAGDTEFAVIVRGGDQRLALGVAQLVGQRELVTRPLPANVGERASVSGGAVLSNGQIALIVDCDAVASRGGAHSALVAA